MRSVSRRTCHWLIAIAISASLVAPAFAAPRHTSRELSASSVIRRLIHWILSDDPPPLPLSDRPSVPPG